MLLLLCRVFLDGKWYGDVKANPTSDSNGYQYCLSNLAAGQTYDITVKVYQIRKSYQVFTARFSTIFFIKLILP
jgi:hypothetical protein